MENYLNLFEHYRQDSYSLPLENNLTRIFARILQDNYYFADNFFRLVDKKLKEKDYNTIYDEIEEQKIIVETQKTIGNLKDELINIGDNSKEIDADNKKYIIGIALTAKNIEWKNEDKVNGATQSQRPDIYAFFNNYHFIFEAKKTEEDCSYQLNEYLKALKAEKMISVTWDEVVRILEKTIEDKKGDIIINEYLEYIKNHFYTLFDYRSLKYSCDENGLIRSDSNKNLVEKRIELAFTNMNTIDCGKNFLEVNFPYVKFVKNKFQQRIEAYIDKGNNKLFLNTWIADIGSQMYNFKEFYKNKKFELKNGKQTTKMYVKFANCGNHLYTLNLDVKFDNNVLMFEELYKITGRLKGQELFKSLEKIINITNSKININDDTKIMGYVQSNTVKDISVGINLEDFIDLSDIVFLDNDNKSFNKNMKASEDKVAEYIHKYIIDNLIFEC